jgi:hypothetical protein
MISAHSMISRWWRMATSICLRAFASADVLTRILEELLGFTDASSRACFRSRRLCVMHPVRYRIGRGREFRVSVVVVWCRLVVWQSGVSCREEWMYILTPDMLGALYERAMSQLL